MIQVGGVCHTNGCCIHESQPTEGHTFAKALRYNCELYGNTLQKSGGRGLMCLSLVSVGQNTLSGNVLKWVQQRVLEHKGGESKLGHSDILEGH